MALGNLLAQSDGRARSGDGMGGDIDPTVRLDAAALREELTAAASQAKARGERRLAGILSDCSAELHDAALGEGPAAMSAVTRRALGALRLWRTLDAW